MILACDMVPTTIELAGAASDSPIDRGGTLPITGLSFAGLLRGNGNFATRSDSNIKEDSAERHDISENHPEIVEELLAAWENYVAENSVLVKSGEK